MTMRVVAGTARGRRLVAPPGASVRPTRDRAREATFNALYSLDMVEGVAVLDLFAGSGAMGIEALSRGALSAVFVDNDAKAITAIRANLEATGLSNLGSVVQSDAVHYLMREPTHFDVALMDPPYETDDATWEKLLAHLDGEFAVLESDRLIDPGPRWDVARTGRYGTTVVMIVRRG